MRIPAPLASLVAAGLLLFAASASAAPIAYAPCSATSPLQCGTLDVPLDRSGAIPGTVRITAARKVAPANPTNAALVGLVGGPGGAALPIATEFAEQLAGVLTTRDLLVFDPRGVGASSPIRCSLSG